MLTASELGAGVRKASEGVAGQIWHILDQVYIPKQVSESAFSWHATIPAGSFVPLHFHEKQDEYVLLLSGRLDFVLDGQLLSADPGDVVGLPREVPHSIHNNADTPVTCLFWVAPTDRLYVYFQKIAGLTDKAEMTRLAAEHGVPFV